MEPEISLYLRTCGACREKMIDRQIANLEKGDDDLQNEDFLSKLTNVHHVFFKVELHVNKHLPEVSSFFFLFFLNSFFFF